MYCLISAKYSLQYLGLMNHDMYLLSLYFVLIGVSEQLGILNNLFFIIDKEVNMPGTVMHHIRFDFFRQLFELSYCFWCILSQ